MFGIEPGSASCNASTLISAFKMMFKKLNKIFILNFGLPNGAVVQRLGKHQVKGCFPLMYRALCFED